MALQLRMTRTRQLIGIGNAAIDVTASVAADSVLDQLGFVKASCIFPDKDRASALMAMLDAPAMEPGGMAANVLCAYAALGGKGRFIGKIGHDAYGEQFASSIRQWHVAFDTVPTTEAGSTIIFTLITPDGERSFGSYYGASHKISPDDVSPEFFSHDTTLLLDCYMLMSDGGPKSIYRAVECAQASGSDIVFMPASPSVIEARPHDMEQLAIHASTIICNDEEARLLTRTATREDSIKALAASYENGAMTLGQDGAYAFENGRIVACPNPPLNYHIVNTNGAGDHFAAAFLYGYYNGMTLEDRTKLGLACALQALRHNGPRPTENLSFLLNGAAA